MSCRYTNEELEAIMSDRDESEENRRIAWEIMQARQMY
jgi:16S rRNA C1402 N4-methylase RsmH